MHIPPLIKRNTFLFALSQTFTGAGMSMGYGIGPLMVVALTGSASLAGLSVGLFGLSRFVVAYPVGKISDAYGRKPGILLGLMLALAGSLALWQSMAIASAWLLALGMLLFGMGMNAAQQMRVAATDMFPPDARAGAGLCRARLAGRAVHDAGADQRRRISRAALSAAMPLGLPWLLLPILIVPGMAVVCAGAARSEADRHEPRRLLSGLCAAAPRRGRAGARLQPARTVARSAACGSPSSRTAPARATWRSSWC